MASLDVKETVLTLCCYRKCREHNPKKHKFILICFHILSQQKRKRKNDVVLTNKYYLHWIHGSTNNHIGCDVFFAHVIESVFLKFKKF